MALIDFAAHTGQRFALLARGQARHIGRKHQPLVAPTRHRLRSEFGTLLVELALLRCYRLAAALFQLDTLTGLHTAFADRAFEVQPPHDALAILCPHGRVVAGVLLVVVVERSGPVRHQYPRCDTGRRWRALNRTRRRSRRRQRGVRPAAGCGAFPPCCGRFRWLRRSGLLLPCGVCGPHLIRARLVHIIRFLASPDTHRLARGGQSRPVLRPRFEATRRHAGELGRNPRLPPEFLATLELQLIPVLRPRHFDHVRDHFAVFTGRRQRAALVLEVHRLAFSIEKLALMRHIPVSDRLRHVIAGLLENRFRADPVLRSIALLPEWLAGAGGRFHRLVGLCAGRWVDR
ncbi:hypothetical protein R75465_08494 [Paraburkholderia aspalathi]|nr:hypothetical protein R75465_08494 [Paraburkholderia aspalathi]